MTGGQAASPPASAEPGQHRVPALQGAGLGLRRGLAAGFDTMSDSDIDFVEVAPENWIDVGGRYGRLLRRVTERFPLVCHGLSLSLGGPAPLDFSLLRRIRGFLDDFGALHYTEHLSYCTDHAHLYDLMPIPFTEEAATYVARRIREVQHVLERRIAIENVSYYAAPGRALAELDFINLVVDQADCDLLLDVNNIFVNSINFGYDPVAFLRGLPGERTVYVHVAGHYEEAADLRVDTHGADVIDPVWTLLAEAYRCFGVRPTLLERDFNFPPLSSLLREVAHIRSIQAECTAARGS